MWYTSNFSPGLRGNHSLLRSLLGLQHLPPNPVLDHGIPEPRRDGHGSQACRRLDNGFERTVFGASGCLGSDIGHPLCGCERDMSHPGF